MLSSTEDEDAPESCSLSKSKRSIHDRDYALTEFHAKEKAKKKERNRQRDRKWKERSTGAIEREVLDVEDEAVNAMRAVREEMGDGEDSGQDGEFDEKSDDDSSGKDANEGSISGRSEDYGSIEDEERELSADGDGDHDQPDTPTAGSRLPDHLFTSAFTARPSPSKALPKVKTAPSAKARTIHKRNRRSRRLKDVVLGSRVVRALDDSSGKTVPLAKSSMLPRRKARRFVDRSLGLTGGNSKAKGWVRRPANIGVLKTSGPAAAFVRRS